MAPVYTYPGVFVEDGPDPARTIVGVTTSTALFFGWTPQGPIDRAVPIASVADHERIFGGLDARSLLGYAVRHFYANGGGAAWIVRVTGAGGAPTGPDDPVFRAAMLAAFAPGGIVDAIDVVNLMVVPCLADVQTIVALERQARDRRAFLIVDCAAGAQVATVAATLGATAGADGANAALYFPWVRAPDPLQGNAVRAFPPSGFVAGVYARTDRAHGVWKAPAGTDATLEGAAGLALAVDDAANGRLNARAVNCLRTQPAKAPIVWGARTLAGDDAAASQWKYVPVRRLALFLEESLHRGTKWAAFEPNGEPLWAALRLAIGAFMQTLFRRGAFQGSQPREAYFIRCDRTTTTQADIDRGVVNIAVGFAPLRPAEFVVLRIRQQAGAPSA